MDNDNNKEDSVVLIDGGYGWVIVVICFVSTTLGDGLIFTYGAFYSDLIDFYDDSISKIMIGGFLMLGLSNAVGPLGAGLVNKFGFRMVMVFGAITSTVAISGSSMINSLFWFNTVMGFIGGTTLGLVLLGAYTMTPLWFDKKRSIACSVAYSGVGFGCIIYPVVIDYLINLYSIRGCIFILGAINLNLLVFAVLVKEPHSVIKIHEVIVEQQNHELDNHPIYLSGEIFLPESKVTYDSDHSLSSLQNQNQNINNTHLNRYGTSLTTFLSEVSPTKMKKIKSAIVTVAHRVGDQPCTDETVVESSALLEILDKSTTKLSNNSRNENCNMSLISLRSQMSAADRRTFEDSYADEFVKPFLKSNIGNGFHDGDTSHSICIDVVKDDVDSPIIGLLKRLFQPELFKNAAFWIVLGSAFLLTIILFAIPQTMKNYVEVIGLSRLQSTTFSITYGAMTIISKIGVGITVRYIKQSKLVYIVSGLILAVATALIGIITSYIYIIFYAVVLGITGSNIIIMRYIITADYIPKRYLTSAYGWTFLVQSATLIVALLIAEIGTEYGNYTLSFIINGILAFCGSIMLLLLFTIKTDVL